MRKLVVLILLLFTIDAFSQEGQEEIFLADPTIVGFEGKYYLTGTDDKGTINGFKMYESSDMKSWKLLGPILTAGQQSWGSHGFWAPQLIRYDGLWHLLYTANEQVVIATSKSITGPYAQDIVRPVDGSEKNIDPFLFIDDDGKAYLYHVRFNHGNYIWCGQFDLTKNEIIPGTLRRCFQATQPWENTPAFPSDPVMEGPTVVKMGKKYYLFYSANHFMSRDYAVGYAVADSPLGPWTKYSGNPIIHSSILGEPGDGHGDIFRDRKNKLYYVYHVHNSSSRAVPRRTRIVRLRSKKGKDGTIVFTVRKKDVIVPKVEP